MKTSLQVLTFLSGHLVLGYTGSEHFPNASPNPFPDAPADVLANLEHYWSYGRSPAVYPTPPGAGTSDWTDAYAKAKRLVAQMTNEEKNNITYGHSSTTNGCAGNTGSVPRLNFPGLCLHDNQNGIRSADMTNAYPAGVHAGASWNRNLTQNRGRQIGAEFRRKGINVVLGPVAGPLGRVAKGGRNWEGFAADPYLSGQLLAETIRGMQESVIACVKHLVANEQETNRNPPFSIDNAHNQSVSSNLDDKTMHELYLWGFQDVVKAGVGSVMCSYNRLNNSYGCQNSKAMNGLLKTELGFEGFVVSDWMAQYGGLAGVNAGLDMVMPAENSQMWANGTLVEAVANSSMTQTRLDDMVIRTLASWYKYAEIENPGIGMPYDLLAPHELVDARSPDSKPTIRQGAIEGNVLVKNTNSTLPLGKPRFLSLFGYDALAQPISMSQPGSDLSLWDVGLMNTLVWRDGRRFSGEVYNLYGSSGTPANSPAPGVALNGTLMFGGGSGAPTPSYIDAPWNAFQQRAREDDTFLAWDFISQNPAVNPATDACIVFINEQAMEGSDRPYLADPASDALVENVASKCSNTIVVIHNAGVRLVDSWIDNPNVTAVIYGHLPGQDTGAALVDIMYGDVSPSGRLPYTVAKQETDYGHLLNPTVPDNSSLFYTQSNFTEGVDIDYRYFQAANITPRFEFGYGLTYTQFEYSDLQVRQHKAVSTSHIPPDAIDPTTPAPEGGLKSLWDVLATVTCSIKNTGPVAAAEVPQLYIRMPGDKPEKKVLRGFDKQVVQPGEAVKVAFELTRRDLSSWDVGLQNWVLAEGEYGVMVGESVLKIRVEGGLSVEN